MSGDVLRVEKTKNLGPGRSMGFDLSAPRDPALAIALAEDKPFPSVPVTLGTLQARAQGDLTFGSGATQATFRAHGGVNAGFEVRDDPSALVASLGLADELAAGVEIPAEDGERFAMLRWGYDINASTGVALTTGAASFGVDAAHERTYAIIRRLPADSGARTVVEDVLESWVMPRGVTGPSKLAPGTWVLTEVDGSFALSVKGQAGWSGNWVREVTAGKLAGEIGLRIQAGIDARLGFSASGRFALAISRASADENDQKIRLRLFKLRKKGWDFALNASASVQGNTGAFLPATFEQLIAGVLGLDSAQVMDDFAALSRWTNPNRKVSGLLGEAGASYVAKLVEDVTGLDPQTAFPEAKARAQSLISAWNDLPNQITSRIWSQLDAKVDLSSLTGWLQEIVQADAASLERSLKEKLGRVDFAQTPEGQWLADALGNDLLAPLVDSKAVQRLKKRAQQTLGLLDGSTVQASLEGLQKRVNDRLGLDRIEQVVDQASFEKIDAWLAAKLGTFLDRELDLDGVEAVRTTIHNLLQKKDAFYNRAIDALNRQYNFSFAASYQKNTTRTALVDVTFDFAQPGVGRLLRAAVEGDFRTLLLTPMPGVSLGTATLTHDVSRQRRVAVHVPWGSKTVEQLNDSLATLNVVDDDGRLLLYDLSSSDAVTIARHHSEVTSSLTVGASFKVPANGVRVRDADGFSYRYTFAQASPSMKQEALKFQLEPYIEAYFPEAFSAHGDGATSGSLDAWLGDLDRALDDCSCEPGADHARGTNNIGNTLLSLHLSLPPAVGAAWLKAPAGSNRRIYGAMSKALQVALRTSFAGYYFQDPQRFNSNVPAATMLTWAALPPSTEARLSPDGTTLRLDLVGKPFWDWADPRLRAAMARSQETAINLARLLGDIQQRLRTTPGFDQQAREFQPTPAIVRTMVEQALGAGEPMFESLLATESRIIDGARDAGMALSRFTTNARKKPAKAIAALSDFGSKVTHAFNSRLKSVFDDDSVLRPLGTQLFVAAAGAFDPNAAKLTPAALLDITVLRNDVEPFPPADFPSSDPPPKEQILTEQRLVASP